MDEIFEILAVLALIAAVGWVLGIAGFVRARRALREIADLRALIAAARLLVPSEAASGSPFPAAEAGASVGDASPWTDAGISTPPDAGAVAEPISQGPVVPEPTVQEQLGKSRQRRPLDEAIALRWGVWAGAGALLLAAVFLVGTAIEEGWLGPAVRCALAALLGLALAAGAEALLRLGARQGSAAPPDWTPGALAAGGAASLFGAAYAAAALYALVPPLPGLGLMAAAAIAGLVLSLRYGPLAAAVGVAGAFATPALVQAGTPSLPGLFGYLLAVTGAAMAVVRVTAWGWLGWAATGAGAAWVAVAALDGRSPDIWAPSLFVPAAAALHLLLLPGQAVATPLGRRLSWVPLLVLGMAGLLAGAWTDAAWPRAGVLLLLPVAAVKGRTEPRLDGLPWLAAVLGLIALFGWEPFPPKLPPEPPVLAPALPGAFQAFAGLAAAWGAIGFAAGAMTEGRAAHGARWAGLAAAVPVAALAAAWWRLGDAVLSEWTWTAASLALAGLHTAMAAHAARDEAPRRAGAYAAGAVAAICLACTVLLRDWWLTGAISLLLPGLALIEGRSGLRPLRVVAAILAAVILGRLLLNPELAHYHLGAAPILNGLLPAYGLPLVAFALSAFLFQRGGEDGLPNLLRAGACALGTALVATEIRHLFGSGNLEAGTASFGAIGFAEMGAHATAFWLLALLTQALATARPAGSLLPLQVAWRVQAAMGLAAGILLLLGNPAVGGAEVGSGAVSNALLPAYLLPGVLALTLVLRWWPPPPPGAGKVLEHGAAERASGRGRFRATVAAYAAVSLVAWATLLVRHLFQPDAMALADAPPGQAELWAYSGTWLLFAAVLMAAGLRRGAPQALRLGSLGLVALTAFKAVFVDLAGLGGLWRALSFLALGLTLILLGAAYRRFGTSQDPLPLGDGGTRAAGGRGSAHT